MLKCLSIIVVGFVLFSSSGFAGQIPESEWEKLERSSRFEAQKSAVLASIRFCEEFPEEVYADVRDVMNEAFRLDSPAPRVSHCTLQMIDAFQLGASVGEVFEAYLRGRLPKRSAKWLRDHIEKEEFLEVPEKYLEVWDLFEEMQVLVVEEISPNIP